MALDHTIVSWASMTVSVLATMMYNVLQSKRCDKNMLDLRIEKKVQYVPTQVNQTPNSVFHSIHEPAISIESYIERIYKYMLLDEGTVYHFLEYLDRLAKHVSWNNLTAHRMSLACATLAYKFHDDNCENNAYIARIGGVTLSELNHLELNILEIFDWRIWFQE